MAKKSKKKQTQQQPAEPPVAAFRKLAIVDEWNDYFGRGGLEDWRRLCRDLGLPDDLPSKTQCRKALKAVKVNIKDFLDAQKAGRGVRFFSSEKALSRYTLNTGKTYPKSKIPKGSPLRSLLAQIFQPRGGGGGKDDTSDEDSR